MKITEAFIEAEKVDKTYSEQSLITPQHNWPLLSIALIGYWPLIINNDLL